MTFKKLKKYTEQVCKKDAEYLDNLGPSKQWKI